MREARQRCRAYPLPIGHSSHLLQWRILLELGVPWCLFSGMIPAFSQ
jgi:hypothetical protein